LADAFGYLAYVVVMFGKSFISSEMIQLDFFSTIGIWIVAIGLVCTIFSWYSLIHSAGPDDSAVNV
jgi:hypothetical protein